MFRRVKKHGGFNTIMNGTAFYYHATVALSFQIEICNLDRTKSSFLATSLYKKVIFTKIELQGLVAPATICNLVLVCPDYPKSCRTVIKLNRTSLLFLIGVSGEDASLCPQI